MKKILVLLALGMVLGACTTVKSSKKSVNLGAEYLERQNQIR